MSEQEVLSQAEFVSFKHGDERAFKKVYDAYVGLVQFIVNRCGADAGENDEIVQEAFFRLYKSAQTIKDIKAIKSWLAITARNILIDRKRKQKWESQSLSDDKYSEVSEPSYQKAEIVYRRELEIKLVRDFILEIAKEEEGGETFKLFYVDGLTAQEIAKKNGEAVSTVTTRLTRMRRKFQEKLRLKIEDLRAASPF